MNLQCLGSTDPKTQHRLTVCSRREKQDYQQYRTGGKSKKPFESRAPAQKKEKKRKEKGLCVDCSVEFSQPKSNNSHPFRKLFSFLSLSSHHFFVLFRLSCTLSFLLSSSTFPSRSRCPSLSLLLLFSCLPHSTASNSCILTSIIFNTYRFYFACLAIFPLSQISWK